MSETIEAAAIDDPMRYRLGSFFGAMFVSGFGTSMMPVVVAYSVLSSSSISQRWFATVFLTGQFVPFVVTVVFGRYVDRAGLYPKLTAAQATLAATCLGYAIFMHAAQTSIVATMAFQAVLSGAGAVSAPALSRTLALIASSDRWLEDAVRKTTMYRSASQLLGQGLSGLLVSMIGISWIVAINGLTFVAMLCAVFAVRRNIRPNARPVGHASGSSDERSGLFAPLHGRPVYQTVMLYQLLINVLVIQPYLILTPVPLAHHLGPRGAAGRWALLGAAFGIGAMLGSFGSKHHKFKDPLMICVLGGALELPLLVTLAAAPTSLVLIPIAGLSGLQSGLGRVLFGQQAYRAFGHHEIGRISALSSASWIASATLVASASLVSGSSASPGVFLTLTLAAFTGILVMTTGLILTRLS